METNFDIIIIGGGPGGYVAAIRASQLGKKVALIESKHLGGICLNWGCIPTKALLRSAEVKHLIDNSESFGINIDKSKVHTDFPTVIKRSREVAAQLSSGVAMLMKKNKVSVFEGFGSLLKREKNSTEHSVKVKMNKDDQDIILSAPSVILATGARAKTVPGIFDPDGKRIWTYKEAMNPDENNIPGSMLIIGSGAIGMEFASFYNTLGTDVTVVEAATTIMPNEDHEISQLAHKAFSKQGVSLITSASVESLSAEKNSVTATINGKTEKFDVALIAIGISANIENIGIENLNIKIDRGHVVTDDFAQTDEPGIYAIGDLTSPPWLAHKASHDGVIAVEHISGLQPHSMKKENIPGCTYTNPQVASIGLSEHDALEKFGKDNIKIGKFSFIGNGKAIALGEPNGLIKTIIKSDTGEILGAHMIGAEVTELIHSFAIAKEAELSHEQIIQTVFPHPTLSETMHEAILDADGRVIHM